MLFYQAWVLTTFILASVVHTIVALTGAVPEPFSLTEETAKIKTRGIVKLLRSWHHIGAAMSWTIAQETVWLYKVFMHYAHCFNTTKTHKKMKIYIFIGFFHPVLRNVNMQKMLSSISIKNWRKLKKSLIRAPQHSAKSHILTITVKKCDARRKNRNGLII